MYEYKLGCQFMGALYHTSTQPPSKSSLFASLPVSTFYIVLYIYDRAGRWLDPYFAYFGVNIQPLITENIKQDWKISLQMMIKLIKKVDKLHLHYKNLSVAF